jgi:hypothetical protein
LTIPNIPIARSPLLMILIFEFTALRSARESLNELVPVHRMGAVLAHLASTDSDCALVEVQVVPAGLAVEDYVARFSIANTVRYTKLAPQRLTAVPAR